MMMMMGFKFNAFFSLEIPVMGQSPIVERMSSGPTNWADSSPRIKLSLENVDQIHKTRVEKGIW